MSSDGAPPSFAGLGAQAFDGVSTYGRLWMTVGAMIAVLIAIVIIAAGMGILQKKSWSPVQAKVAQVQWSFPVVKPGRPTYTKSTVLASFTPPSVASGAAETVLVEVKTQAPLKPGDSVQLYLSTDGSEVRQTPPAAPRQMGWLLVGGGLFYGAVMVTIAYLGYRSKNFAAVQGAATLFRL